VIAVAIFAFVEMEHVEEIAGMLSDTSVLAIEKARTVRAFSVMIPRNRGFGHD
jgi:hypothetical protein